MPRTESKTTQSRPQLRAVITNKQWHKINSDIELRVRQIIKSDDEAARNLAYITKLIFDTPDPDREGIVSRVIECAFVNSDTFWSVRDAWADGRIPEQEQVRKRA